MGSLATLLERNRRLAVCSPSDRIDTPAYLPRQGAFILSCVDPRTDPAFFFRLEPGDAIVARTVGGRVTPAVLDDLCFFSQLVDTRAPDGPWFEVAVVHHTECGSRLLADAAFREALARRRGTDPESFRWRAVTEPEHSVRLDAERIRSSGAVSERIRISGYVYNLGTGLVSEVATQSPGGGSPGS